jgi:hypothetical protein
LLEEEAEEAVDQVLSVEGRQIVIMVRKAVQLSELQVAVEHKQRVVQVEHPGQELLQEDRQALLGKEVKEVSGKLHPVVVVVVDFMVVVVVETTDAAPERMAAVAVVPGLRLCLQVEHVLLPEMLTTDMLQLQFQLYLEYLQQIRGLIALGNLFN